MGHLRNEKIVQLFTRVDAYIESRFDQWSQWRRHLHAHPELSWQEVATTEFVRQKLAAVDLKLNPGPRGLGGYVDLRFGDADHQALLALRGDMDAIPILEANEVDYRSQVDGVMHACGHDVHTTVVLAVCDTIQHLIRSDSLVDPVRTRMIFQPAEEVAQGASESIQAGMIDDVDAIIAMHVDSSRPVGQFGFRDFHQTACCDELRVTLVGTGGHGARPHEAADPIFAASQYINAAYATIPRIIDARRDVVLSFCKIAGGHSANVIPVDVEITGTLRSFDATARQTVLDRLRRLAESLGQLLEVEIRIETGTSIPSVTNCPKINSLLKSAAESFAGPEAISVVEKSLGGEDFAVYQQQVPGALVRIGSAGEGYGTAHLHSPHFNVDEGVIRVACRLFVRSILQWSAEKSRTDPVENGN